MTHAPDTRRRLLLQAAAPALLGLPAAALALDEPPPRRPERAGLQAGDFLWPRRPNQWVPYAAGAADERATDKLLWLAERDAFVAGVRADPASPQALRQLAADMALLEYSEFYQLYMADEAPGTLTPYGNALHFYVGHVAIVDYEGDKPMVIEALMHKGVVRSSYDDWLAGRPGAWVWQGRLAGRTRDERARIADRARQRLNLKYNFWNFDLADTDAGTYCSKLAWHATLQATGVALDGNPEPRRGFWFSPKQMLKCRSIEKLHNPGSYGL